MIELKPYRIDIGERFGTLTVLRKAARHSKRGGELRVVCDCSYAFLAKGSKLKRGLVKCPRHAQPAVGPEDRGVVTSAGFRLYR